MAVIAEPVAYRSAKGVDDFVRRVHAAEALELVESERQGVDGQFLKDLSKRLDIPAVRMFEILGVPKATAEKKAAGGERLAGSGGQAALGLARLLGLAQQMAADSTAPEAESFDAAQWLGRWLEEPQPALGGRRPADLVDTPTGLAIVRRLMGSLASGSYQ